MDDEVENTTILLVRHAHTEANEHGSTPRMAGWCDLPLSGFGEQQLRSIDLTFFEGTAGVIYSSPSSRALRTAAAIACGRPVIPLSSLREIGCGKVEGWLVTEVQHEFPELWERNLAQDDPEFRWPGGESYRHFRVRVLRVLRAIAHRHPGQRVIAVTHAGAIAQVAGHTQGITPAEWERNRPPNCSVTSVSIGRDGALAVTEFGRPVSSVVP